MLGFIEIVNRHGNKRYVNVSHIVDVIYENGGTKISLTGVDRPYVTDMATYDEVVAKINSANGFVNRPSIPR